jgi:hypothetical protein
MKPRQRIAKDKKLPKIHGSERQEHQSQGHGMELA